MKNTAHVWRMVCIIQCHMWFPYSIPFCWFFVDFNTRIITTNWSSVSNTIDISPSSWSLFSPHIVCSLWACWDRHFSSSNRWSWSYLCISRCWWLIFHLYFNLSRRPPSVFVFEGLNMDNDYVYMINKKETLTCLSCCTSLRERCDNVMYGWYILYIYIIHHLYNIIYCIILCNNKM